MVDAAPPPIDPALRRADAAARWSLACQAAVLMAVDPPGLGGVALRGAAGPLREGWLAGLRALLPGVPWRRVPLHISDERLLGGIDLAATLQAGRPVAQRGLLAEADGGIVQLAMAERLGPSALAHWAAVMDHGEVRVERDGLSQTLPTRFGVVALDEGREDDEICAPALLDRLAFHVDLSEVALGDAANADADGAGPVRRVVEAGHAAGLWAGAPAGDAAAVQAARAALPAVTIADRQLEALCAAASALGVASLRAPLQAVRAARAAAALAGRREVDDEDIALAARLVLAPRATRLPEPAPDPSEAEAPAEAPEPPPPAQAAPPAPGDEPPPPPDESTDESPEPPPDLETALQDVLLEAARAAMPAGLLARLRAGLPPAGAQPAATHGGRAGAWQAGRSHGRPAGVRRGAPRPGVRLNLIETLRAAAPWQLVRRAARGTAGDGRRIEVRADDFHTTRTQQRRETTTVFAVDASGSAALHRLAEAKGAVELLLAECYVRRDRVAVIGFRGRGAELLLPPTRSLVRAKRSLAGLPGGGGTPLAAGIDAVADLTEALRRRGDTAVVVLLTDGRANIGRDGQPGRDRAAQDALDAGRRLRLGGLAVLLVDTSPHPAEPARRLAEAMGAHYLPLPYAGAAQLSQAIQLGARALARG